MPKILGIDLGTTNSCMAVMEQGEPRVLENSEGARTTPSQVALARDGQRLVGVLAKRQAVTNPENTIFSVKRLMGRRFQDQEVVRDRALLPYHIQEAANGGVEVKMGDKWYSPQELSAMILAKLKVDAEAKLGEKVTEVIITVPAYFDDSQRKATKEAGEIAGFTVRRIINEPTAAALAYGLGKPRRSDGASDVGVPTGASGKDEQIAVYDFGGGTFDVSVLDVSQDTVEVKATGGDTHLGGDDFDQKIIKWIVDEYKKQEGIDLAKDRLALQRLKEAGERAKIELSTVAETEINLPFITSDASGPKHLVLKLSRATLESLVADDIARAVSIVTGVVKDSGFALSDIDEVVLVGGQTRMPAIQESVKKLFGKEPHQGINPDEVVAVGAAVQGGILGGEVKDVLLLDVTPLSLGIETLGGVATQVIQKNTTIPVSRSQVFSTAADNQPSVEVHVLQGERPMAADNKSLGKFMLEGLPPSPRGMPQVEVTFDIDANGILSVKAKDKATGKEQSIRIEASTGLSKEEIERMKQEAETHATEDREKRELIEAKNNAESMLWATEKSLKDLGEKVPEDLRKEVSGAMDLLRGAAGGNDGAAIRRETQALSRAAQKIGEHMYRQGQEQGSPPPASDKAPEEGNNVSEGETEPTR